MRLARTPRSLAHRRAGLVSACSVVSRAFKTPKPSSPGLEIPPLPPPPTAAPQGCWRWVPVVHLDGLLGGATNVSITVSDSTPQEVEEEVDPHFEHWVLTVQCGGRSLHEVMAGVTASPLQAITFDAEEVRVVGRGGVGVT